MNKILDGKMIAGEVASVLSADIQKRGVLPVLVIIQIGEHEESDIYVERKKGFAKRIGATVVHHIYATNEKEDVIIDQIRGMDQDPEVHGIIIQVPIPEHFDLNRLTAAISQKKDVDGMSEENMALLYSGQPSQISAAAEATRMILDRYGFHVKGKKVVVVGDSVLVGKPTARVLADAGAIINVCNSDTKDVAAYTKEADIIVVAVGKPGLIGPEHVSPGQVVIDIGTTVVGYNEELKRNILAGDVDFEKVKKIVRAITPVPGGVGPVTIAALFTKVVANA